MDGCVNVIKNLEASFTSLSIPHNGYIFPDCRMIVFDYSSYLPLIITDAQQLDIMNTYKDALKDAKLTIVGANQIQTMIGLFD
jgi:hypothetical protein